MASVGRKRTRSDEVPTLSVQNKIFINQKLIDQQDQEQMKQIYGLAPNIFTVFMNNFPNIISYFQIKHLIYYLKVRNWPRIQ